MTSSMEPIRVVLYTRPGCHLCDLVRDDLTLLGFETDLSMETVDITTDAALTERFHALIPVVDIAGGPLLTPPITLGRLRAAVLAARSSSERAQSTLDIKTG